MSPVGVARARNAIQSHWHHQHRISGQLELIMKIGLPLDALDPGFQCVRTHWIRGFMAFQLVRRTRSMMLTVPAWPEFGVRGVA
jgi:hypothetical protein